MTDDQYARLIQAQNEVQRTLQVLQKAKREERGVEEAHEAWIRARAALARLQEQSE